MPPDSLLVTINTAHSFNFICHYQRRYQDFFLSKIQCGGADAWSPPPHTHTHDHYCLLNSLLKNNQQEIIVAISILL
jgi:hypothetical protein